MTRMVAILSLASLLLIGAEARSAHGTSQEVVPLADQWSPLAMITGFHSVPNRAGWAIRVLEADGSASVAENPVALFIVATNGGTSNLRQNVWRLPEGVERVKRVAGSRCGVDIQAEVDNRDDPAAGPKAVVVKTCFIRANGELESRLRVEETN
jgi:hypothetical protein